MLQYPRPCCNVACKQREVCGIKCNFLDRQVIDNSSFNTLTQVPHGCKSTWVSLSFPRHILYFLCYIIILIMTYVLTGTTSHLKKYSHVLWAGQKTIYCWDKLVYDFVSVYTNFCICCDLEFCFSTDNFRLRGSRDSYEIRWYLTYTLFSIGWKIVSVWNDHGRIAYIASTIAAIL